MTMHICHPALSLNGKKKGKKKFRNSESAQAARKLGADWQDLKQRWGCTDNDKKTAKPAAKAYVPPTHPNFKKRDTVSSADPAKFDPCTKNPDRVYTGDKILGIGTMHKSNAVPIFSDQEAKDISSMRR